MPQGSEITCWTMVKAAAEGDSEARGAFAERYLDVVRACLGARWRGSPLISELDDAAQDVFLECFRPGGPLTSVEREGRARFRSYLFAVTTNIARRHEERQGKRRHESDDVLDQVEQNEASLATAFDQAWARAMIRQAGQRQRVWAEGQDEAARRRVEILRLRFGENRPVREIAETLGMERELCHAELRRARGEFQRALREEVLYHNPGGADSVDAECLALLKLLRDE